MTKRIVFIILYIIMVSALGNAQVKTDDSGVTTKIKEPSKKAKIKNNEDYEKEIDNLNDRIDELNESIAKLKEEVDEVAALRFKGFFDVSISNFKNKPNVFALGDFELDIEHTFKENFQVAAALVFYQGADLAVGFIDYHIFGGSISPRGRLFEDEGLHIQVGKFDIPFGNDWQHFSAVDRLSVTSPLTTEMVMDGGYNDEGARILLNFIEGNLTLYVVDGIEEKQSYGGNSYGGRIGLTPFNNPYMLKNKSASIFELGFSYIHDIDSSGYVTEKVYAVDVESEISPFTIRSEYYKRDKSVGVVYDGYHVTGALDFNDFSSLPVIIYSRYDFFRRKNFVPESIFDIVSQTTGTDDILSRVTAGLNINIYSISFLKLEYQQFLKTYEDYEDQYYTEKLYYAQLVITF